MTMQFVVIAWDEPGRDARDRRAQVRGSHLAFIESYVRAGRILVGGAILDDDQQMIGSVVLCEFATEEDLEDWLQQDPYVTGGVWHNIEVRPFRAAVGSWVP